MIVPQGLAYGELAGLPPVTGLYAALLPLLLYPVFASSRRLMVGPESGLAILTATALAPLAAARRPPSTRRSRRCWRSWWA